MGLDSRVRRYSNLGGRRANFKAIDKAPELRLSIPVVDFVPMRYLFGCKRFQKSRVFLAFFSNLFTHAQVLSVRHNV